MHPEEQEVSELTEAYRQAQIEAMDEKALRAEVHRLIRVCNEWGSNYQSWVDATQLAQARAEDALAEVERLTRELQTMDHFVEVSEQVERASNAAHARAEAAEAEVEQLIRHPTHILERWMIGWYDAERNIHWINPRDVVFAAPDDPAERLDREATEPDARERLRQAEEQLAKVKAMHRLASDGEHCFTCVTSWHWPCPTASELQ
jgi:hypothetical protein